MSESSFNVVCVSNHGKGASFFNHRSITLKGDEQRFLSDQIAAVNFRLRTSCESYESGWHVAGDPTLLIMLQGKLRLTLRNGDYKDFTVGEMFIAEDYLEKTIPFDAEIHGHKALVVGDEAIRVLHLKLSKR